MSCDSICSGGVENGRNLDIINKISILTLVERTARVDEYYGAVVFMLSTASSYMTAAVISVDGSQTVW